MALHTTPGSALAWECRDYVNVREWMQRAADARDRPLPLLIVSGPPGAGKSVGVRAAARDARVQLIELGSDSTDAGGGGGGGKSTSSLSTRTSLDRWREIVRARTLRPRILFIDDAESLLRAPYDSREQQTPSVNDIVALGAQNVPVVVAVYDFYATPVLRALKRAAANSSDVLHVVMARPNADTMHAILSASPQQNATVVVDAATVRAVVAGAHGDVRRARNDLYWQQLVAHRAGLNVAAAAAASSSSGDSDSRSERDRALSRQRRRHAMAPARIGVHSNVFDVTDALLGVAGSRLPDGGSAGGALERVLALHAPTTARLVFTHYLDALPPSTPASLEFVATIAAPTWAALDAVGHGTAEEGADGADSVLNHAGAYCALVSVPTLLRHVQRTALGDSSDYTPDRLDYSGPLGGAGEGALYTSANEARRICTSYANYTLKMLADANLLRGCERGRSARELANNMNRAGAVHRLHAIRDELALLALRHGEVALRATSGSTDEMAPRATSGSTNESVLQSFKSMQRALDAATAKKLGVRPWDAPRTIEKIDVAAGDPAKSPPARTPPRAPQTGAEPPSIPISLSASSNSRLNLAFLA